MILADYAAFTCGGIENMMPVAVANLVSMVINVIKVLVPVILIVMGLVDFTKAITKQKEDEIKKSQMVFVKRLIAGLLVFFIVAIVQFAFSIVNKATGEDSYMGCVSCFVNGVDTDTKECK